ncbi:hypothetical protein K227x_48460 [Rubripirellula lacrimiformis]|uniref:Glycosyltransferase RgtA/B/C/D-like domain-containing protein n=2 Tax=Rubripirellula lacrimiformis TaxID=1930273 RepID=A0A517NH23_9BACT|nr:hypothetical protein K227x_48460 [Rubripirellula lacrimiformis]
MLVVAWVTGRCEPHHVDDTFSYLNYPFDSLGSALRSIRTPGYPIFLRSVIAVVGESAIPVLQILLHAVAAWWLGIELRRRGTATSVAIASALAVALGCTFMDHVSTLATDAPAASMGVMAAVAMLRWDRLGQPWGASIGIALFSILAISLRPAYLSLAPWALVCGICLWFRASRAAGPSDVNRPHSSSAMRSAGRGWSGAWRPVAVAPAIITVAVIAWMGLRGAVVGDFGVLPFGHQNLAGLTIQLVDDDELIALDHPSSPLAHAIIRHRRQRIADGYQFPGGNPTGDRSVETMTIEGRWNDLIYQAVVPAAREIYGDDTIANHNAIASMNRQIVSEYPLRYAKWLLLGARRAAWAMAADIVMHPLFLVAMVLAAVGELWRLLLGRKIVRVINDDGIDTLCIVALTYAVAQVGFVILTSPPLGRFTDAAAILVPAWIAAKVVQHFRSMTDRSR